MFGYSEFSAMPHKHPHSNWEIWYNTDMSFPYSESTFRRKLKDAAKFYWQTRDKQASKQKKRGKVDAGTRGQVTGGRQLDGFARLVENICLKAGFRKDEIFFNRAVPVPGYYRPQKNWDVVVLRDGKLIAAIELKSQSGSFGNNFNNRSEEVLGVSRDFWTAYRERVFGVANAPWLGYLFFLEDSPASNRAVALAESPLPPLDVFMIQATFDATRYFVNALYWSATSLRRRFWYPTRLRHPCATAARLSARCASSPRFMHI